MARAGDDAVGYRPLAGDEAMWGYLPLAGERSGADGLRRGASRTDAHR
jgi:hypothetical protein